MLLLLLLLLFLRALNMCQLKYLKTNPAQKVGSNSPPFFTRNVQSPHVDVEILRAHSWHGEIGAYQYFCISVYIFALENTVLKIYILNPKMKVWFRWCSFSKQVIFRFQPLIFQWILSNFTLPEANSKRPWKLVLGIRRWVFFCVFTAFFAVKGQGV